MSMPPAQRVWPALAAIGLAAEVRSLRAHDHGTASEFTIWLGHMNTPLGRSVTGAVVGGAAGLFIAHLCNMVGGVQMNVQTFWLETTDQIQVGLRRYTNHASGTPFNCAGGYHSALVITSTEIGVLEESNDHSYLRFPGPWPAHDDPRWPATCEHCDHTFSDDDPWQEWQERLYRRTDNGELVTLRDAPDGACWDATWMPDSYRGPDGIALMVKCPGGHDWMVDSRASNCTRPDDNVHHCWVRHGDPRECRLTVDKNGDTCSAGAGSILTPNWHGFLRDGQLVA